MVVSAEKPRVGYSALVGLGFLLLGGGSGRKRKNVSWFCDNLDSTALKNVLILGKSWKD